LICDLFIRISPRDLTKKQSHNEGTPEGTRRDTRTDCRP
jgi:hypothetical protein